MSFPTAITPDEAWPTLKRVFAQIKSSAQQLRASSASGPIGANNVIAYVGDLADMLEQIATLSAVPGLATYAQEQTTNGAFNIVNEYGAARTAAIATRDWVIANFPKDGSGNLLEKKFDANGRVTLNTFSSASLSGLRTQLDALIATIN